METYAIPDGVDSITFIDGVPYYFKMEEGKRKDGWVSIKLAFFPLKQVIHPSSKLYIHHLNKESNHDRET